MNDDERCWAPHPKLDSKCYLRGNHPRHCDNDGNEWENPDYITISKPPPDREKEIAKGAADESLPIDENHTTNPREPKETQIAAADLVFPKSGTQRRRVFDAHALVYPGDLTEAEGIKVTGIKGDSWRPRRKELEAGGWLEETANQRQTGGPKSAPAYGWRLTEKGAIEAGLLARSIASEPEPVGAGPALRDFG